MKNGLLLLGVLMVSFTIYLIAQSTAHAVNPQSISPIKSLAQQTGIPSKTLEQTMHSESIVFGLGCFWGAEMRFEKMPGVINVLSGYADGSGFEASYSNITQSRNRFNPDNYAEVIQVTYHPDTVSVETLIKAFFEMHNPTQRDGQGNDIGTQYRSTILTSQPEHLMTANALKMEYQKQLNKSGYGTIITKIKPLDVFYIAEDYHQDYIAKNPNGYCPDHSTGVTFAPKTTEQLAQIDDDANFDNTALMKGQHIVVIDAEHCPYCEKFKENVANEYQGDIPMHFRTSTQLNGLTISSPTWATPTLLFMEDGKETYGIQGYVEPKTFYKALGAFKLGQSEAFDVAFNKSTDARFCKQYEEFNNVGEGVFIDTLSGDPLFDTQYQFNSGTGWLSFTQAIAGSVTYHEDNRYGMKRVEIKAKKSGIHLGHVFADGPNGSPRYCINATVLGFEPRVSS